MGCLGQNWKTHVVYICSNHREKGPARVNLIIAMNLEIITSRLLLRPFTEGDLPALAELFADVAVQRYLAVGHMGPVGARDFAATFMRASHDEWREGGCGVLSIVPRGGRGGGRAHRLLRSASSAGPDQRG
jgi:RimJ/RimL family protein N-acetyltransferase